MTDEEAQVCLLTAINGVVNGERQRRGRRDPRRNTRGWHSNSCFNVSGFVCSERKLKIDDTGFWAGRFFGHFAEIESVVDLWRGHLRSWGTSILGSENSRLALCGWQ